MIRCTKTIPEAPTYSHLTSKRSTDSELYLMYEQFDINVELFRVVMHFSILNLRMKLLHAETLYRLLTVLSGCP